MNLAKRRRRLLPATLLVLAMSTACQSGPAERKATEEEKDLVTEAFLNCIRNATHKLDDRISDAYVVGSAIVRGPCYGQADDVARVYTRGANARVKEMFRENFFERSANESAAEIVLAERAKLR